MIEHMITLTVNNSRTNDLWTHISFAVYGFIIPDSRSYLTIGSSGGHRSGVGYKITQDTGKVCGGYCSREASDNYNYYWLWDVYDLVRVKNGDLSPYSVRPYAYGELPMPFQGSGLKKVTGASFDNESGRLFISLHSRYAPLITVFKINLVDVIRPESPVDLTVN